MRPVARSITARCVCKVIERSLNPSSGLTHPSLDHFGDMSTSGAPATTLLEATSTESLSLRSTFQGIETSTLTRFLLTGTRYTIHFSSACEEDNSA
ncbi:hypothetical protein U1Q18_018103 [Sarracenia purpurea var. burkii]